ncbi:hypothetical protein FACS189421_12680 [Bacteroidia bacterium]|nr:hypothetical protein FACS189421_12680 [Bacteroidia bacterium]
MNKILLVAMTAPLVLAGCSDSKNDLRKYLAETNLSPEGIECSVYVIDKMGYTGKVLKLIRETEKGGQPKFDNPMDAQRIAFVTQASIMGCNAAVNAGEKPETVLTAVKKYMSAIESGETPENPDNPAEKSK